jgi:SAM-dependent methyltransferase
VREVRRLYGHLENVEILQGDLEDPGLYEGMHPEFDSVLCVNVLEHLDEPGVAVSQFYKALRPGGKALVLVPAHDWLFSDIDAAIGHRTRYSRAALRSLLEEAGFTVESVYEFNRLGVLGWWVNKLTNRVDIGRWQARAFSLLLPIARLVEHLTFLPGLSVVAVARVP